MIEPQDIRPIDAPSPTARVFMGEQGLRAGWSALLFFSLVLAFGFGFVALDRAITHTDRSATIAPAPFLVLESGLLGALFLATLIMARIERRSVLSYGFQDARGLIRLLSGMIVGFLFISGVVGVLWMTHALVFDGKLLHGTLAWRYGLLWLVVYLVVALFEEGLLRGYLQYTLTRGLNFWTAAAILSVLFGLLHTPNAGESPLGIVVVVAGGLVFCLSLKLTGSLWWVVGLHTGIGFAESYFYGTANSGNTSLGRLYATHPVGNVLWSGGATGPEGSVYCLLALPLLAAGIWLTWGARRGPDSRRG